MPNQEGDKQHEATEHRKDEARKQGQIPRSQDLSSAALLLLGLLAFVPFGDDIAGMLGDLLTGQLSGSTWMPLDIQETPGALGGLMMAVVKALIPLWALLLVGAIVFNLAQVGFVFLPETLAPKWDRVNPLKGVQRLFSLPSFMRLTFGVFKVIIVGAIAGASLYFEINPLLGLAAQGAPQVGLYMATVFFWTSVKIAGALLVLALLDYGFQRWKHNQDLRMTTQELRDEMKQLQGDPQIAARRRQVQRQLVMNRMGSAVPDADFVVTNPTELAVAIKYDIETMAAPVVVAKGAGTVAQRIRRLALEHGIPVIERKPLAQALYKQVELNHPIPVEWYAAVAELLRYVYELKGKPLPKLDSING